MARLGFNEYQKAAMEPASDMMRVEIAGRQTALVGAALGLTGEAGEFADLIKKVAYHGHPLDHETHDKLVEELGDILWYVAMAATSLAVDMRTLAEESLAKLKARYPEGFSTEKSIYRNAKPIEYDPDTKPTPLAEMPQAKKREFDREAARQAAEKALEEDTYDLNEDYHEELEDDPDIATGNSPQAWNEYNPI